MTTEEIRAYIQQRKAIAKEQGLPYLVLRSGDIHKELGLKNRHPMVCSAMFQCKMDGDRVLNTTESNQSTTIEIQYFL